MKLREIVETDNSELEELLAQYKIENYTINSDGSVDVDQDVDIVGSFVKFPFKFGKVTGNFKCRFGPNLTTLENGPHTVTGSFDISYCNLTSLIHAPTTVTHFSVIQCKRLVSLKGAPVKVPGRFECSLNEKLPSLEHSPKFVGETFNCTDCPKITSFKGAPKTVGGNFIAVTCKALVSLEGSPETVGGSYSVSHWLNFESFDGLPHSVKGSIIFNSRQSKPNSIDSGIRHIDSGPTDFLKLLDVREVKQLKIDGIHAGALAILNKWLPTQNTTKAQQELEKAGFDWMANY